MQVVSSDGTAVAGAAVTATINGASRTATSDSNGVAVLATYRNLRSGCFDVAVVDVVATPSWNGDKDTSYFCKP